MSKFVGEQANDLAVGGATARLQEYAPRHPARFITPADPRLNVLDDTNVVLAGRGAIHADLNVAGVQPLDPPSSTASSSSLRSCGLRAFTEILSSIIVSPVRVRWGFSTPWSLHPE